MRVFILKSQYMSMDLVRSVVYWCRWRVHIYIVVHNDISVFGKVGTWIKDLSDKIWNYL